MEKVNEQQDMSKVLVDRYQLEKHVSEIDSWNASMEKIIGKQPDYRWASLETLRAALSAQLSAPERVSVPKLAGLKSVNHQLGIVALSFKSSEQTQEAVRELRALLASHAKTGKTNP